MRRLTLDFEQRDMRGGTAFIIDVHGDEMGTATDARRVTFSHGEKASAPLVLDGYVLAVLIYALEHVDQVIVNGPVSAKALRNIRIWSEAWHAWRPTQYRPVEIIPGTVVSEAELRAARSPKERTRAIAAFSGGVDSTFLALRHSTGMLGEASFPLADVVLVHGFDVRRGNTSAFDELLERTKPLTDSLGLRVHVVRTDVREQLPQDWEHAHGALLASILHQFSDRFEYGLIGSTFPYRHPFGAWGSLPATDYLLSGGHFEIVHEGAGFTRTEKVELIAGHPVARRAIKVCWEGKDQGRNCGACDKCVRTRLHFMAVGVPEPECFDTPLDLDSMASLSPNYPFNLEIILEHAERRGLKDEWVALLRERVTQLSSPKRTDRATNSASQTGQSCPDVITSRPRAVAPKRPRGGSSRARPGNVEGYRSWLRECDPWPEASPADGATVSSLLPAPFRLSIVVLPTGVRDPSTQRATMDSLLRQTYPNWEAALPCGSGVDPTDGRFRVVHDHAHQNGTRWLLRAVYQATGEYIVPLPGDARLAPHGLLEIVRAIAASGRADLIYADEDAVDDSGARLEPRFKPAWDPELALGRDVVGQPSAIRTDRFREVLAGGLASRAESVEALLYDLSLRVAAAAGAPPAHHIPRVLLSLPLQARAARALDPSVGRTVVADHLAREGQDGVLVVPTERAPAWNRVIWPIPTPAPRATIIVPTRDQPTMLARCAEGVLERTDYPEIELLVVDNGSDDAAALDLLRRLGEDQRVRVLRRDVPFNFSELNNLAAREASGDVLVLLNDDTEVTSGGWLRELVSQALRPEVGIVGARLLYPEGTVQHAGIIVQDGRPHHQFRLSDAAELGPYGELALARSVSAVTGACLALRKSVFEEIGGLDEALAVSFGDVDLCLRVSERGYRVICTPFAELRHHESTTRGYEDTPEKRERMARELEVLRGHWGARLRSDPYANPNLHFTWDEAGEWGLPHPPVRRVRRRSATRIARSRVGVLARRLVGRLLGRATILAHNPLFSSAWYVAAYPEVSSYRLGAYQHYRRHGVAEGRKPNQLFDTQWYLERYPDVAANGMNPLDHYLRHGAQEGRDPGPDFSTLGYLDAHPDVRATGENPLLHYFHHGNG